MGHRFRFLCQVETGRLLQLMGVLFAVVLVVQYFELPYGNVLLSLFSAGKVPIVGKSNFPSNSETIGNTTLVNGLNSTDTFSVIETANITETSEGKDRGQENGFFSERNVSSDKSFGLVEDSDSDNEPSSENLVDPNENSTVENVKNSENGSAPEKAGEPEHSFSLNNVTTDNNSLLGNIREEDTAITSKINVSSNNGLASPPFALSPMVSSPNIASPTNLDTNSRTPVISVNHNTSPVDEDAEETVSKDEKPGLLQSGLTPSDNNSSMTNGPAVEKGYEMPTAAVVSVSEMNDLLLQSRASSRSMKPRWSSAVDQELLNAKSQIENAPIIKIDAGLYAPLYRNVSMFKRSYELMEQTLKVYIYREGGKPVFHQPVLKGIYASEGWFMKVLVANKYFVTKKPRKAHLFYLPFSSRMLEETLYVPNSHSHKNLIQYLKNYLDMIVAKYPFWNRTGGADHFLVACHDWAPSETRQHMANCIRALCNSDIKEGFRFGKDVSLPETYVRSAQNPLRDLGGKPPSQRRILAFFAGNMHGYLRPILLQYWGNKDPDMKFFSRMPRVKGKMNYIQHMKSSKYCICAKGYEVNSPRVVEAIFYECVPVIISDNFVPPFFEVLDWESFAVFVLEKDIPNLKNILLSISKKRYLEMQMRVKKVQQHFIWHPKPVKYDLFHMILHSIWYNRVFQIRPR